MQQRGCGCAESLSTLPHHVPRTTLHLCGSSLPHVSMEPPSEHSETFSYWGQPGESCGFNEIWGLCWDVCRKIMLYWNIREHRPAEPLLIPPLILKVIGHQLSMHRASQGLWPTQSCQAEKREMGAHPICWCKKEEGGTSNQGSRSGSFWVTWNIL